MRDGSWSFHARAVFPTVSSPNWASMIMGAPVEMTGVLSNEWQPVAPVIPPACSDAPSVFPTIFSLERQQHPSAKVRILTDWPDFMRLVEPGVADRPFITDEKEDSVMEQALTIVRDDAPEFVFIHLDHVDHAGHTHGWGSPEYLAAVEKTDRFVGELRDAVRASGKERSTTILLTADHGGTGRGHGGLTMEEAEIPWIVAGPHVRRDHTIPEPVMQYDTAATAAMILGVRPSICWYGRVVTSAFAGH
jgi:predicted AlkP superfamily pyrophosphatase or phosphodiesterase